MAQKPIILALETSSRIGSVALGTGDKMLAETTFSEPLRHSAEIFPVIRNLMDQFGYEPGMIEHTYISIGPGSFTGLRIAATAAKMMNLASSVKVVSVDTLDVIAANITVNTDDSVTTENDLADPDQPNRPSETKEAVPIESVNRIATILDAKRGQFFIAIYERNPKSTHPVNWVKALPDSVMSIEHFLSKHITKQKPTWLLGDGLVYYKERFRAEGVQFLARRYWSPKASKVYLLGRQRAEQGNFADPVNLAPSYLLRPDIKIKTR